MCPCRWQHVINWRDEPREKPLPWWISQWQPSCLTKHPIKTTDSWMYINSRLILVISSQQELFADDLLPSKGNFSWLEGCECGGKGILGFHFRLELFENEFQSFFFLNFLFQFDIFFLNGNSVYIMLWWSGSLEFYYCLVISTCVMTLYTFTITAKSADLEVKIYFQTWWFLKQVEFICFCYRGL